MTDSHRVKRGDHASRIAADHGFRDYRTVWHHPENDELRELRNPNVLCPGDGVHIPEKTGRSEERPTGARHAFVLQESPLELIVQLQDVRGRPLAGCPAELHIDGDVTQTAADAEGLLRAAVPKTAREATVVTEWGEYSLSIGYLTPADDPPGYQARLVNLGYLERPVEGEDSPQLREALEELQCDQDLPVTGQADDATRARLVELHGC